MTRLIWLQIRAVLGIAIAVALLSTSVSAQQEWQCGFSDADFYRGNLGSALYAPANLNVDIPLVFHIADPVGDIRPITDAQVVVQTDTLNQAFQRASPSGAPPIRFTLAGIHSRWLESTGFRLRRD